jgi:hypothetical protein
VNNEHELALLRQLERCCRVPQHRLYQMPIPYLLAELDALRAVNGDATAAADPVPSATADAHSVSR